MAPPAMGPVKLNQDGKSTPKTVFEVPSIVGLIASYSHYADMKNLLSTCKAGRAAMEIEILARESCLNGSKTECWGCMMQVCEVSLPIRSFVGTIQKCLSPALSCSHLFNLQACRTHKKIIVPDTTVHLESCQPYCSKCHLKRQYASEKDSYMSNCYKCRARTKDSWSRPQPEERVLCRNCATLSDDEIRMMRDKRERIEMEHLLQWPLRCEKCHAYLDSKRPCWWGCMSCYGACNWDGHPSVVPQPDK
jgi:hypothetical protein